MDVGGYTAWALGLANDEYDDMLFYGGKDKSRGRRATGRGTGQETKPDRHGRPTASAQQAQQP